MQSCQKSINICGKAGREDAQTTKKFRQQRGHRRAVAVKSSIIIFERTTIAVNRVQYQQTVNIRKSGKTVSMVFRRINSYFIDTRDKRHTGRQPVSGSKDGLHW